MSQKVEEFNVKKEYGDFSLLSKNDFISKYNINFNGLTDYDVLENQKIYGKNEISGQSLSVGITIFLKVYLVLLTPYCWGFH